MVGWPDRLLACTGIQLFPDLRSLQGLTTSVAVKASVLCASTGNLTLSSTQVIDRRPGAHEGSDWIDR